MNSEHEPVRVEVDETGGIVRIFKTTHDAVEFAFDSPALVKTTQYRDAVEEVRRRVFERANSRCEWCGVVLTWRTGQMHEMLPRSRGGEISLANSVFICYGCHQGRPESAHGDRRWGGRQL